MSALPISNPGSTDLKPLTLTQARAAAALAHVGCVRTVTYVGMCSRWSVRVLSVADDGETVLIREYPGIRTAVVPLSVLAVSAHDALCIHHLIEEAEEYGLTLDQAASLQRRYEVEARVGFSVAEHNRLSQGWHGGPAGKQSGRLSSARYARRTAR